MKKVLCFLFVALFMMSLASVAWADVGSVDQNYAEMEKQVEKANLEISELVTKAAADADRLLNQYKEEVIKIGNGKDILENELDQLTFEIGFLDSESKGYEKINKEIEKLYAKINDNKQLEKLTQDLEEDIDKIIAELLQHTNKIANKTIEAGEKEEVIIECSIIEVEIGGETVLVDPLRIRRY
ncbi:MAG: hypothetical protein AAGU27_01145 [Dehalobacterium sp.]